MPVTNVKAVSVVWFGTGSMSCELLPAVNHDRLHIQAFVDEYGELPRSFANRPVIRPAEMADFAYDAILVACRPTELIIARLVHSFGIMPEKIISLDFEDACFWSMRDAQYETFEHALETYLFAHPGMHEAFFLYTLMQSVWLRNVKAGFSNRLCCDNVFFSMAGMESSENQPQEFLHAMRRPPALPDLPKRWRSMQIETTAHCGYRCFCCASHKAKRRKGVMSKEDVALLTRRVGDYSGDALLHHGGEPLLDKELPEKVALLRQAWPDAVLTFVSTLGVPVSTEYFDALWKNGLNEIEVSHYGYDRETYRAVHGVDTFDLARKNLTALLESRTRQAYGGRIRVRMLHLEEHPIIVDKAAYVAQAAVFRAMVSACPKVRAEDTFLSSHSGQGSIGRKRATLLPCSVAWGTFGCRMNVTWDMHVVPCCQDFDNHIVLGNLRQQSLEEIFTGQPYRDFMRATWSGDFSRYPLCRNCERSISGNRDEFLRIFTWKIAEILHGLPQGPDTAFSIIGEGRFIPYLTSLYQRHMPNCMSLTELGDAVRQGKECYIFIAAVFKAQLACHQQLVTDAIFSDMSKVRIIPLAGSTYSTETAFADAMRDIYTNLELL